MNRPVKVAATNSGRAGEDADADAGQQPGLDQAGDDVAGHEQVVELEHAAEREQGDQRPDRARGRQPVEPGEYRRGRVLACDHVGHEFSFPWATIETPLAEFHTPGGKSPGRARVITLGVHAVCRQSSLILAEKDTEMHRIAASLLGAVLFAGPVLAQTAPAPPPPHHRVHPRPHRPAAHANPDRPVDVGPYTPDANRAYNGGGVVLQGAPGAPAPSPRTPLPPR